MFGTSSLSVLSSFDHQNQDWKTYKSRLQQWCIANGIDEQSDKAGIKRRAVLLSALTESTYQLASNLALPDDIATKSYESILGILDEHFIPKRCGFAERYNFYAAMQQNGETHGQWAARLRGLAAHCAFKNLEESLLDKFVMGMLRGPERERLFAQEIRELTLSKAVELAESVRCAREGAAAAVVPETSGREGVFKIAQQAKGSADRTAGEKCLVCGYKNHKTSECRFSKFKCRICDRKGHLRRMCPRNKVKHLEQGNDDDEGDDGEFLKNISCPNGEPLYETVCLEGRKFRCEIDSGSPVSVISEKTYKRWFSGVPLSPPAEKLFTYDGGTLNIIGVLNMNVEYLKHLALLSIYVVRDGGPPLLGRDFMREFKLELISTIGYCKNVDVTTVMELTKLFPKLFSNELGCFNKFEISLTLKDNAKPVFIKSRPVPFALKDRINAELERLVSLDILEPVKYSDYASPIVPVLKNDGSVRICADYSCTINKQLLVERYPLPSVQELFTKLHNGEEYSKLDLSMAYMQFRINKKSQKLTCINTPRGLFNYTRLVFGLSSAPAIFQRAMESLVGDMEGVYCYLDDLVLTAENRVLHERKLKEVLCRLQDAGLTLRKDKCAFFQNEVSYLGYTIDKNGIRKNPDKVKAILDAAIPKNLNELQSFLGLINYYRNFVPNASSILSPLHFLLQKGVKWHWNYEQDAAFTCVKKMLASEQVLAHFITDAKTIVTVDASPVGLGAILSQEDRNGVERPVSYASRSLTPAEKKYSQIQKEATAIIFGVKKFHQFLYGRSEPFTLRTDHKPLTVIFGNNRGIPEVTANRLQRYAIFLSAYNYNIEYVNSASNTADFLSRALPVAKPVSEGEEGVRDEVAAYEHISFAVEGCLPVTRQDLQRETACDSILKSVAKYVANGWPRKLSMLSNQSLKPYYLCRNDIALENGILMRGHKVIIPQSVRGRILEELHSSHFGIVKMKADARSRLWFPGIDAELEKLAGTCRVCAQLRPSPPRAALAPWPYPDAAFHRIHLDFFGPLNNKVYLIIVDAYSKWIECYDMNRNSSSKAVIAKLCEFMSRFGVPKTIVSDNGTAFASQEFSNFCMLNDITQLFSPIYHPSSNGQAESFVKIVKKGIKTIFSSGCRTDEIPIRLAKFLFDYRNSVNSTTGTSPAQLVFGHPLRSRLDLLTVNTSPSQSELPLLISNKQSSQAKNYGGKITRDLEPGEQVWFKQYINKSKSYWAKGVVIKKTGKVMYDISFPDQNKIIKRHKNQLYVFKGESGPSENSHTFDVWDIPDPRNSDCGSEATTAGSKGALVTATGSAPPAEVGSSSSSHTCQPAGTTQSGEAETMGSADQDQITATISPQSAEPVTPTSCSASSGRNSPQFSTPQPISPTLDKPAPGRPRRNKPSIDFRKFF